MALTIDLPHPLEQQFKQEADSKGLRLDNYLVLLLKQAAQTSIQTAVKPVAEAEILKKINAGISESEWTTYRKLNVLRREERLTESEYQTLITLGEKIEQANVERVTHLIALAQLRGVSIQKLMSDLGIKPVEV